MLAGGVRACRMDRRRLHSANSPTRFQIEGGLSADIRWSAMRLEGREKIPRGTPKTSTALAPIEATSIDKVATGTV